MKLNEQELEQAARVVYAEGSVFVGKNRLALLAIAQCMHDLFNTGEYRSFSDCLSRCFTASSSVLCDECVDIVRDVFERGEKRFSAAKILQFRSFTNYSDGQGNLDIEKCSNLLKSYDYLGSDSISLRWGHFYFGKKGDNHMVINQNPNFEPTHNTSPRSEKPRYIVIHYTGSLGDAKANVDYYNRLTTTRASADFFIAYDGTVYQYNNDIDKRYTWAVGKKWYDGSHGATLWGIANNSNCINIEMCVKSKTGKAADANSAAWYFENATVNAAIELTKYLMQKYNIDADHVVRHYDVCGKYCPGIVGWNGASGSDAKWLEFKSKLGNTTSSANKTTYCVPQIAKVDSLDGLNLRSSASSLNNTNLIVTLPDKHYVNIIDNSNSGWCKVQTVLENKNYIGYVYAAYLKTITKKYVTRTVTDPTGLNIRATNAISGTLVATMGKSFVFNVLETMNNGWGFIQCGNTIGYCSLNNAYSKTN